MAQDTQTWLVTGAATGFGRAIAERALSVGHNVVITARNPSRVNDLVAKYRAAAFAVPLDVADPDQVSEAVRQAEAHFSGPIDVVVNAAGYNFLGAVEEVSDKELRDLMETHFFGVVNMIKAALPGMRSRGRGHFFNFSSTAGLRGAPGTYAYSAAKFAVEGLSESLAAEVALLGIKVTILQPGPFQTSFFAGPGGQLSATVMAEYADVTRVYRELVSNPPTWCPGDPERAAAEIVGLAMRDDAPLRLPLGKMAHYVARSAHRDRLTEVESFKEVSLSLDFPECAGRTWP